MSLPSPLVRPWLRTAAVCSVLFAGTVLLFSRGLGYGFSNYDDPGYITNNVHVQAGLTWESIVWAFTGRADYWHPLTWLSHMIDWELFADNAAGHHLTSVLWHALNAALAFGVLRRLTGCFWLSALSAALFAWHPLRVESVVWITERKDVMSGCFFLLTLWSYAAYVERRDRHPSGAPAAVFYALTLACFVGGLMCKPMVVTIPAVLLILDFWPLRRAGLAPLDRDAWRRWQSLIVEKLPLFALSAITSVVTVLMQQDKGAFVLDLPLGARLGNAIVSIPRYVGKFIWPFDLTVCYSHPGYWAAWLVVGAGLLVGAALVVGWRQRTRRPWLLAGSVGFIVMLLPTLGLVQVGFQAMADRYTYVPIFGLQFALLWTLRDCSWLRKRPAAAASGALLLLAALGVRAWDQQFTWRSPVALFEHALAVTERNEFAHALLGYTLASVNRFDEAATHARRALELNPKNETALFTVSLVHARNGEFEAAIAALRSVIAHGSSNPEAGYRLSLLLLQQGRRDEARDLLRQTARTEPQLVAEHIDRGMAATLQGRAAEGWGQFDIALLIDPDQPAAHFGAGLALSRLNRTKEAIAHHEKALQLSPGHPEASTELGLLLVAEGEASRAEGHLRTAVAARPEFGLAHLGLGRALEQLGRSDEALASYLRAAELSPDSPALQRSLAQALARRHRFDEAARHYQKAVDAEPHNAELRAELGYALLLSGRRAEAVAAWKAALAIDPDLPGLRSRLERFDAP